MPRWEDNFVWKKQHIRLKQSSNTKDPYEKFPTPESFREHCFEFLKKSMNQCDGTNENCSECIRKEEWDKPK